MTFEGCTISLNGTFANETHASIGNKIKANKGKYSNRLINACTHLICNSADFDPNAAKVRQAAKIPDIKLVNYEWLLKSIEGQKKEDEKKYQVDQSGDSDAPRKDTADENKARSPTPIEAEILYEEKKDKQTANGKKRARSPTPVKPETPNKDEEEEKPPEKKQKSRKTGKGKKRARSPTPVKAESQVKYEEEDEDGDKAPEKKQKIKKTGKAKMRAQSPAVAKAESVVKDDEREETEESPDAKPKDAQKAKDRPLFVPVDEQFAARSNRNYTVYIGDDGTIWDASLNQTVAGYNKNKFYRIQVLQTGSVYTTLTRWGRVGEAGQQDTLTNGGLDSAIRFFEKKFKDKSGLTWANRLDPPRSGKYTFIERNYEESDDEGDEKPTEKKEEDTKPMKSPDSKLSKPVQSLMELIFNQQYFAASLNEMSYDAKKLPLGKLSKRTLMMGYEKLKALADLIGDLSAPRRQAAIAELSDAYYTAIPHVFGRNRPPVIGSDDRLKKEIALLESLSDMEIANALMKEPKESEDNDGEAIHPLDQQYSRLGMQEMTPRKCPNAGALRGRNVIVFERTLGIVIDSGAVDSESDEFKLLNHYLLGSSGQTHNLQYKVQDIFRIERNGETERFEKSPFAKLKGDRRLLWHGSRCTNYGGILSQGLRIAPPEAPVSGYMFGKGVYLADVSSKSANYCCSYLSGHIGLLLLCEAEVGKPMLELTNASSNAAQEAQEKGCVATWGKGLIGPVGWKDASCVHPSLKGVSMPDVTSPPGDTKVANASLYYNEYIVYDVAQIKLRYLLRMEIK